MGNLALLKKLADLASKNNSIQSNQSKSSKTKVSNILRPKTKAEINDGSKYKKQLGELDTIVGKNTRLRALSNWALNFFDDEPDIENVAKFVSKKVDQALIAPNHPREMFKGFNFLDAKTWDYLPAIRSTYSFFKKMVPYKSFKSYMMGGILSGVKLPSTFSKKIFTQRLIHFVKNKWSYRTKIDKKTKGFRNTSSQDSLKYRIPMTLASSLISTDSLAGKCEEHTFLSLYLLSVGQMVQNMPHGQLKNDIFFTGAATKTHAMVLLAKGKELKKSIIKAKTDTKGKKGSEITRILNWLITHTDEWGANAWIIDGWDRKNVKALSKRSKKLVPHYGMTQGFRRDTSAALPSKWDFTIRQMIYRVAKAHGITIK